MLPVYLQIKEKVARDIAAGVLAPGELIPSESELMRTWAVSRITARNVVKELSKEGLVYTLHGRGSFVAQPRVMNVLPTLNSYSHDVTAQGMEAGSRVLAIGLSKADKQTAARLLIAPDAPVIRFRRLHLANRKPVSISHTSLPVAALGPAQARFTRETLENHSLYDLFADLGFRLAGGEQEIAAANAGAADAKLLDVAPGAALLYAERVVFTEDRIRIECTRMLTRPDRSRWKIELGPMQPAGIPMR